MKELMLLKEVAGLGEPGDVVKVRSGFARNFLLPRRLAAPISADAVKQAEAYGKRRTLVLAKKRDEAAAQVARLENVSVHVEARAAEGGTLYGSVTAAIIAEAITKEGVAVEASGIVLAEPIKELGIYEIGVKVFADVTSTVKLYVVAPPPEDATGAGA